MARRLRITIFILLLHGCGALGADGELPRGAKADGPEESWIPASALLGVPTLDWPPVFGEWAWQLRSWHHFGYGAKLPELFRRLAAERRSYLACDAGSCDSDGLAAWRRQLRRWRGRALTHDLLAEVSTFLNAWRYTGDGPNNDWATPLEFFTGQRDCEDYAIIKYVTLRELGLPTQRMRFLVSSEQRGDERLGHAVLSVLLDDRVFHLDNRTSRGSAWPDQPLDEPGFEAVLAFDAHDGWRLVRDPLARLRQLEGYLGGACDYYCPDPPSWPASTFCAALDSGEARCLARCVDDAACPVGHRCVAVRRPLRHADDEPVSEKVCLTDGTIPARI